MKNNINNLYKKVLWFGCSILAITAISACSKSDEYKKYTEGGEISYTGKLDSVVVNSGKYRVIINGLFMADPKVKKCVVYWNNKADSVVIPVTRTKNVDTLNYTINNMSEGVQNFVIYTVDVDGNRSIPVYKTGRVFGDRYQASLSNRGINSAFTNEVSSTVVEWSGMDRLSGVFATEVIYKDNNNVEKTVRVPIDSNTFSLANFKEKGTIKYRTLFLPDSLSVDTFYSEYTNLYIPKFIKVDVTATYLQNTGTGIKASSMNGTRWGILANWITSASVKNASGGVGGFENKSGGVISFEAGWGLPNVTDGKIYQTITLPEGNYRFEIVMTDFNTGGSRFLAVAEGSTLPNVANITSGSIAFSSFESKMLNFTLDQSKQVSLGFAATLTGSANAGMYAKIPLVKLYRIDYL